MNFFVADFEDQTTTGFTATVGPGSFSYPINYTPASGASNPTRCLKIGGGQTGWGQTGICMTNGIPSPTVGYMIFFQFAIDGGQAVISLETSNTLWSSDANKVQIHYNHANSDLYSGTINSYPDAEVGDEWLDHYLEVTSTGAILGRHRHYTTPGSIKPFSDAIQSWSLGSWGLTDVSKHTNYSTEPKIHLSISFWGTSGQACYLDEVYVTTNGLLQRPPTSPSATPISISQINTSWTDNAST